MRGVGPSKRIELGARSNLRFFFGEFSELLLAFIVLFRRPRRCDPRELAKNVSHPEGGEDAARHRPSQHVWGPPGRRRSLRVECLTAAPPSPRPPSPPSAPPASPACLPTAGHPDDARGAVPPGHEELRLPDGALRLAPPRRWCAARRGKASRGVCVARRVARGGRRLLASGGRLGRRRGAPPGDLPPLSRRSATRLGFSRPLAPGGGSPHRPWAAGECSGLEPRPSCQRAERLSRGGRRWPGLGGGKSSGVVAPAPAGTPPPALPPFPSPPNPPPRTPASAPPFLPAALAPPAFPAPPIPPPHSSTRPAVARPTLALAHSPSPPPPPFPAPPSRQACTSSTWARRGRSCSWLPASSWRWRTRPTSLCSRRAPTARCAETPLVGGGSGERGGGWLAVSHYCAFCAPRRPRAARMPLIGEERQGGNWP